MSPYSVLVKKRARDLRARGYSFREISLEFGVAKSTASVWTRGVRLSVKSRARLRTVSQAWTKRGREVRSILIKQRDEQIQSRAVKELKSISVRLVDHKLVTSSIILVRGVKTVE